MKVFFKSFFAGFLSTLTFHQGLLYLYYLLGLKASPPYNMALTQPLGIPSVISLAFFGGLWGVFIWKIVSSFKGKKHWLSAFLLGAIGPTAVAFIIVFPLKGIIIPLAALPLSLLLNGAWGIGNSVFMKVMSK